MRQFNFTIALIFIISFSLHSQSLDTLVDVGGYNLHFKIVKGNGTPILFESGLGSDGSVWNNLLEPIHNVTGTTLITYDRAGFGQSEVNLMEKDDSKHGIVSTIDELEIALKKLGYDKDIILVGHSYGGSYAKLFASRHPNKVKYVIMVDSNPVIAFTDEDLIKPIEKTDTNLGIYYWSYTVRESNNLLKQTKFPLSVPVIDLEADKLFTNDEVIVQRFRNAHTNFVNEAPNRVKIRAVGSGHSIHLDNPSLVINTIIKAYSSLLPEDQKIDILERALDNALELSIEAKKRETEYVYSEDALNRWGYTLMQNEELEKALVVFKLNTVLFPENWNVYDSYGEALMGLGKNELAIKNYKKSIEINPGNQNGIDMLKKLGVDTGDLVKEFVVASSVLESYVGKYELKPGFILTVSKEGNQMKTQATGQSMFDIFPKSINVFYVKAFTALITFNKDDNGKVVSLTLLQGAQEITGNKIITEKDGKHL